MACEKHEWFFDLPCPKCVAAAVTPELEIPDFLRRNKYSEDPEESAAQRKAEYAADEQGEGHEHATDLDGTAVHNLLGKRD